MTDGEEYDLVVVGGGPGGYVAAVRAAELGMKTACVEKDARLGGVCLNVGCIPSKALLDSSEYYQFASERLAGHGIRVGKVEFDLAALMARKEQVVKVLGDNVRKLLEARKVRIVHGAARLAGGGKVEVAAAAGDAGGVAGAAGSGGDPGERRAVTVLSARAILLATGSEPVQAPSLPFDGVRIVSSTEALSFDAVPEHLGVVGGGYIGLELGSVWKRLGARVTVMEMLPKIATTLDGQVARTLERALVKQGVEFRLGVRVADAKVGPDGVRVGVEPVGGGRREEIAFDRLLVAVGRRPLTRGLGIEELGMLTDPRTGHVLVDAAYRTNVPGIHAVGDVIPGPMLAHKASAEGVAAVECIAGLPGEVDYDAIPAVVYTWPEVASVGLTEEQLKERDVPYKTGSFPFAGTGRARSMGETEGFVKVLAHALSDRVLGVHIIGPRASDLIHESVSAIRFGARSSDIAHMVHAHPTLAEAVHEAADAAWKKG